MPNLGPGIKWIENAAGIAALLKSPQGAVGQHLQDIAIEVENEAKRLCSNVMVGVVTGRLRSSITHIMGTENGKPIALVGTNVSYAIHVHESGRPFLTTALKSIVG